MKGRETETEKREKKQKQNVFESFHSHTVVCRRIIRPKTKMKSNLPENEIKMCISADWIFECGGVARIRVVKVIMSSAMNFDIQMLCK